jgi:hypothetical protein
MKTTVRVAVVAVTLSLAGAAWFLMSAKSGDPARLFPEATEVRAFAWGVTPDGRAQVFPDGVPLTKEDVAVLRQSVRWTESPEAIAMCCIPRHAFKFYDEAHNVLGTLEVCFECTCATLEGEDAVDAKRDWLDWDVSAIEAILKARKMPIEFEQDAVSGVERPKR